MSGLVSDPRIASARIVAGAPGLTLGDEIVRVEQVDIDGKALLLPTAAPGVPEYIAAATSELEADNLRPLLTLDLDQRGHVPYQPNAQAVFGFYAAAGTTVTAAVAGLEAFANHHVARVAGAAGVAEYRGQTCSRKELWNLPLNERLGEVIPALTGKPSPKETAWWPTLRRIQGVAALSRHGITQPVARKGLSGEKSLTQRYCDREYSGAASMMLDAFAHFEPKWVNEERLSQLPRPPNR